MGAKYNSTISLVTRFTDREPFLVLRVFTHFFRGSALEILFTELSRLNEEEYKSRRSRFALDLLAARPLRAHGILGNVCWEPLRPWYSGKCQNVLVN